MITTALLVIIFPIIASALSNFPIVRTSYGAVRGYEYETAGGFVGEIYKKIPYASPPTGSRRWKKAVPPQGWNYTVDGTFFGPSCAQVPSPYDGYVTGTSEDCLTLAVYTSKMCRESSCPVAVYVHGGSVLFGGPAVFLDETLVRNFAKQGIVLVTIQYRLGVFGELTLGDENAVPANLAIHDVVESLRFVRNEIHNFGGNKDEVTVMGHSSGATLVTTLVFSPAVNKANDVLFTQAISMSTVMYLESAEKQINLSRKIAASVGCTGSAPEIVDCLRPLSEKTLIQAATDLGGPNMFNVNHLGGITFAGELLPIRNLKELRDNQAEHMKAIGQPTKLLIGTTVNEFRAFGAQNTGEIDDNPSEMEDNYAQMTFVLGVSNSEECAKMYRNDLKTGKFDTTYDTLSQAIFMTTSLFAKAQVYLYQWDYAKHARHADDLYYVMNVPSYSMNDDEKWIQRAYPQYFANFIKGVPLAQDWSALDPELMNYYSFNKSFTDKVAPKLKFGYHQDLADYYEGMMQFDEKLSKAKQMV